MDSIEKFIRRSEHATYTEEYNCLLRRLYPWPELVETKRAITEFGAIWVQVEAYHEVDAHSHDEEETFIVTSGEATLIIGSEETLIHAGDVVYIPRHYHHQLINKSDEMFSFVDIFWDMEGQSISAF